MSGTKLTTLTDAQVALQATVRDEWLAAGLSTEPADRPTAEKGIRLAYELAGLTPPMRIVWCGSPLSQGLTRYVVMHDPNIAKMNTTKAGKPVGASVWDSVRASVGDSVGASVGDSVRASVGASVWDSVRASVGDSVRASVRASVWASVQASVQASVGASVWDSVRASVGDSVGDSVQASVGDSVWDSVRASVRDSVQASVRASVGASVGASVRASVWDSVGASVQASVGDSVRDSVGEAGYGQHDAGWLAFYDYFALAGLKEQTAKLGGLWLLGKSAGWFLPHQHICWVSERPNLLLRDDRGRLHAETGPALRYPDGWGIYAWHGVRVKAEVIDTPADALTVAQINAETNQEVRRVLLERMGWGRYLRESGAAATAEDLYGKLYRLPLDADRTLAIVEVVNGTPEPLVGDYPEDAGYVHKEGRAFKKYFLRVPSTMQTPHEAVAWTYFETPATYTPVTRT